MKEFKTYTALISRNFRDMAGTFKVLLRDIKEINGEEFRCHCFVEMTEEVKRVIPKINKCTYLIKFTAKHKEYKNILTGEVKLTLHEIKDIKILRNQKIVKKSKKNKAIRKKR